MTWETLNAVRQATKIEFVPWLAQAHHFVRLPSGRWTRTLGVPDGCTHIRGNTWAKKGTSQ